jgi:AraC-like DNA-binding protein
MVGANQHEGDQVKTQVFDLSEGRSMSDRLENRLNFTVHSHFVIPILKSASKHSMDVSQLLRSAGLSQEILDQPEARFTVDQYNTLVKQVWIELEDEHLGLLPVAVRLGTFRVLCELSTHAENIRGIYERLGVAYGVLLDYLDYGFSTEQGLARVQFNWRGFQDEEHIVTEWTLLFLHRFSCWLTDECRFGADRNEIAFDPRYLHQSPVKSWRNLGQFISRSPGILMALPASEDNLAFQIRRLLLNDGEKEVRFCSFEQVADLLHTSQQTLRRRLRAEGSSFQQLKNTVRRDLAIDLLTHTPMTIANIAARIGFSETSGFSRAFKEWTGLPPNAYREGFGD